MILERTDNVEVSVSFNFLSILKKEKSISDTNAPPIPKTIPTTCNMVAGVFIS